MRGRESAAQSHICPIGGDGTHAILLKAAGQFPTSIAASHRDEGSAAPSRGGSRARRRLGRPGAPPDRAARSKRRRRRF